MSSGLQKQAVQQVSKAPQGPQVSKQPSVGQASQVKSNSTLTL